MPTRHVLLHLADGGKIRDLPKDPAATSLRWDFVATKECGVVEECVLRRGPGRWPCFLGGWGQVAPRVTAPLLHRHARFRKIDVTGSLPAVPYSPATLASRPRLHHRLRLSGNGDEIRPINPAL